jgi:succinyl-diaminopimelate desuccinylase
VGEPSSATALGDMIKVGRRGSVNATITVEGVQGHVAYPHRAANPIPVLIRLLDRLQSHRLDEGYPEFQPSNLEVTDITVGNPATNVIPAKAEARLNIRFNPAHTGETLVRWIKEHCKAAERDFSGRVHLKTAISGEAFLTEPGPFTEVAVAAVKAVTGRTPELSTTGGTSDARFVRSMCPVIEFGLVGTTMHMVDERAPVSDIRALTAIYERLIEGYFARFA